MAYIPLPNDPTSLLVDLCIKVLKENPDGMTTKELAAALEGEVTEGFNGISSSILSSKLNAVFRRCSNVSQDPSVEDPEELPLSRAQSTELPKRLVYKFTPKAAHRQHSSTAGTVNESDGNETLTTKRTASMSSSTDDGEAESNDDENVPLTPKEEDSSAWPVSKKQRVDHTGPMPSQRSEPEISRSVTPPNADIKLEKPAKSRKGTKTISENRPKFNLYYDVVGFDAVSAALDCGSDISFCSEVGKTAAADADQWVEYVSPETYALNDLDQLIS